MIYGIVFGCGVFTGFVIAVMIGGILNSPSYRDEQEALEP